jgi:hypothetical protein
VPRSPAPETQRKGRQQKLVSFFRRAKKSPEKTIARTDRQKELINKHFGPNGQKFLKRPKFRGNEGNGILR